MRVQLNILSNYSQLTITPAIVGVQLIYVMRDVSLLKALLGQEPLAWPSEVVAGLVRVKKMSVESLVNKFRLELSKSKTEH